MPSTSRFAAVYSSSLFEALKIKDCRLGHMGTLQSRWFVVFLSLGMLASLCQLPTSQRIATCRVSHQLPTAPHVWGVRFRSPLLDVWVERICRARKLENTPSTPGITRTKTKSYHILQDATNSWNPMRFTLPVIPERRDSTFTICLYSVSWFQMGPQNKATKPVDSWRDQIL